MSDTESNQAYNDASEASIPAENGPREVANDPPPLGSAEESENDPGVAARTRLQRRLQNDAGRIISYARERGREKEKEKKRKEKKGP